MNKDLLARVVALEERMHRESRFIRSTFDVTAQQMIDPEIEALKQEFNKLKDIVREVVDYVYNEEQEEA